MKNASISRARRVKAGVACLMGAALLGITGCSDSEVGDVSLGLFTTKDIKIDALQDPVVTGVTCHIPVLKPTWTFPIRQTALLHADKPARLPHRC